MIQPKRLLFTSATSPIHRALLACALAGSATAQAQSAQSIAVDAQSNLFLAGTDNSVSPSGYCASWAPGDPFGDGRRPPLLNLPAGIRSLQIAATNAQGVSFSVGNPQLTPQAARSTPDGTYHYPDGSNQPTAAYNHAQVTATHQPLMKGLEFDRRFGTLAAVFWGSTLYSATQISTITTDKSVNVFSSTGGLMTTADSPTTPVSTFNMNAPVLNYGLGVPFFIGDGSTVDFVDTNWPPSGSASTPNTPSASPVLPTGNEQRSTIQVPAGATSLYLGFTDAWFVHGFNGCYSDNGGSVNVALKMTVSDDAAQLQAGSAALAIQSVITNDTINSATPDLAGNSTAFPLLKHASLSTLNSTDEGATAWGGDGITLDPATGAVHIAASTPVGIHKKWYTLCDNTTTTVDPAISSPSCANALITLNITATAATPVVGVEDDKTFTGPVTADTVAVADVRANDSVGGATATSANAVISQQGLWSGFSLNTASGSVTVIKDASGNYPSAGNYTLAYQLCELDKTQTPPVASATNCTSVPVKITIPKAGQTLPTLQANNDAPAAGITLWEGQAYPAIVQVLTNDSYNGNAPATTSQVSVQQVAGKPWPTGFSWNTGTVGGVDIANTVKPGSYALDYQICDLQYTAQCSSAVVNVQINARPAPAPVPTLGQWAMMLLSALLAATAAQGLRRRMI